MGETVLDWMLLPLKRYAEFTGRSRRKEYWMFFLFCLIVSVVANIIDGVLGMSGMVGGVYGPVTTLFALAVLVPSIAVGIRRLHDTNRSGWWILIALVPLIGAIVLLVFYASDGTNGDNQYGPDPKSENAVQAFG
jgi:uncharacterized membrane protein YhaH (DUF805 family)